MLKKSSFPIYLSLLLVWAFFYIRKDYMWITGDDANLATQAMEFQKGLIPNTDFVSGYPGLSGKIQSYFLSITDNPILSQHLFSASLSSILVIILFKCLKQTNRWTVLLYSIFIFMQQHLVNPTPNPGYLFEIFTLLGIIFADKFRLKNARIYAILSGFAFAGSVMSKQYGLFTFLLLFSFFILASDIKSNVLKKQILYIFAIFPTLLFVYYYLTIGLHNGFKSSLTLNFLLFVIPCVFALATFKPASHSLIMKTTLQNNIKRYFIILYSCNISLIFLYFFIYGVSNPIPVLRTLYIDSPKNINENLALIIISPNYIMRGSVAALMVVFFIKFVSNFEVKARNSLKKTFITILVIFTFWKMGNLSGTPFVPIMTLYLIFISNRSKNILFRILTYNYLLYTVLLIPYSNYSFHITFIVFLLLIANTSSELRPPSSSKKFNNALLAISSFVLIFSLIGKEYIDISRLPRFQYDNVIFRSGDAKWALEIRNMISVHNQDDCHSSACEFLWLSTSKNFRSS